MNFHNSNSDVMGTVGGAVAVVCANERGTVAADAAAGDTMSSEGWGA